MVIWLRWKRTLVFLRFWSLYVSGLLIGLGKHNGLDLYRHGKASAGVNIEYKESVYTLLSQSCKTRCMVFLYFFVCVCHKTPANYDQCRKCPDVQSFQELSPVPWYYIQACMALY